MGLYGGLSFIKGILIKGHLNYNYRTRSFD